jgi:hypothetical protein
MRGAIILILITLSAAPAYASSILSFDLAVEYSAGTPPSGPAPWLRVIFADVSGGVQLTLINQLHGATEFVPSWMFNLDPALDPLGLNFATVSGTRTNAAVSIGENAFRAAGGGYFDIRFTWPTANSGDRFVGGDVVTYFITSNQAISAMSFDCLSAPGGGQGPFVTAAKVQGIGANANGSGWITVPEPIALWLLAMGLAAATRRPPPRKRGRA